MNLGREDEQQSRKPVTLETTGAAPAAPAIFFRV